LHRAAAFGTEATIQMLLDAGARADAKDMRVRRIATQLGQLASASQIHSQKALLG
jgi:hypothetical protein